MACRFWDRHCAGYLEADDLQRILLASRDTLSRACIPHALSACSWCLCCRGRPSVAVLQGRAPGSVIGSKKGCTLPLQELGVWKEG